MQTLFIYDNNGTVVTMLGGVATVPSGVQSIVADAPARMKSAYVDVAKKQVIFEVYPDTEDEVNNLQNAVIELDERVSALEG